jgi:hypothetical protein
VDGRGVGAKPSLDDGQTALVSNAGEEAEMDGRGDVYGEYIEARGSEEPAAVGFIEDMVVKAAVIDVVEAALLELFQGAGGWVAGEVVFGENFREVREVVFADVVVEVGEHVGNGGRGAVVVEGVAVIGEDEDEGAAGTEDTLPLVEGFDGIGEVFEIVGGEQEVVAVVGYGSEVGAFAKEGLAGGLEGTEEEFFLMLGPDGGGGEVAIIEGA